MAELILTLHLSVSPHLSLLAALGSRSFSAAPAEQAHMLLTAFVQVLDLGCFLIIDIVLVWT